MCPRLGDLLEEKEEYEYTNYRIYREEWAEDRAIQLLREAGIDAEMREVGSWWEIWVPEGKTELAWRVWKDDAPEDDEVIDAFMDVHHAYIEWSNTFRHKPLSRQGEPDWRKERARMRLQGRVRKLHEVLNG